MRPGGRAPGVGRRWGATSDADGAISRASSSAVFIGGISTLTALRSAFHKVVAELGAVAFGVP
jgi:hypothetical protein